MPCHVLGDLQLAPVLQVGGDPGGAEAVGADLGAQTGDFGPPAESSCARWPGAGECGQSAGHVGG